MKDTLIAGFWLSLLTAVVTAGATVSLKSGLLAFAVGFLAFGVIPAIYEQGKPRGSKATAESLAQQPKTAADYTREEMDRTLAEHRRLVDLGLKAKGK
jgi:hypothetical protein